jgi:hypothetical protein
MTRVRLLLVAAALAATTAGPAWADRYEASLGLSANGRCRADRRTRHHRRVDRRTWARRPAPATRPTTRGAYDLQLVGFVSQPVTYPEVERDILGEVERGAVSRRTVAAALTGGVELRLGPRLIPTVRLGLGPQVRHRTASDLGGIIDAIPSATTLDVAVSVGLGFDLRLSRRRVLGLCLRYDRAQPIGDAGAIDAIALSLRLDHYWYPRWQAPVW